VYCEDNAKSEFRLLCECVSEALNAPHYNSVCVADLM